MMSEAPKYLMRFVGFKEDGSGELKRTSPSGFTDGELRDLPYDYSLSPWWEIVDDIPDLVLPEEEDSVYEDGIVNISELEDDIIISRSDEPGITITVIEDEEVPEVVEVISTNEGQTFMVDGGNIVHLNDIPPYINDKSDAFPRYILPVNVDPEKVDVIRYEEMTVKSLKLFIEQRDGTVDNKWRKRDLVKEARRLEEALRATLESS